MDKAAQSPPRAQSDLPSSVARESGHGAIAIIRQGTAVVAAIGVFVVLIFWPAGRIDWLQGWIYVGIVSLNFIANVFYLRRVNPEVIEHRMRLGPGTKRWDVFWSAIFAPMLLAVYIIAGFDAVRFEWSSMSPIWWIVGIALFIPGTALYSWSMGVNPFFEKTVRIQTERGHRVIDTGPYAFVRHPGYLGFFGWCLSAPLLLGSWWAFSAASLTVVGLVIRTALEDRTLREELEGYEAYTARVRYRLIPGIW